MVRKAILGQYNKSNSALERYNKQYLTTVVYFYSTIPHVHKNTMSLKEVGRD